MFAASVAYAQAPNFDFKMVLPEDGCPKELPDEDSMLAFCQPKEQFECSAAPTCVWAKAYTRRSGDEMPAICTAKRGTYVADSMSSVPAVVMYRAAEANPKAEAASKSAYTAGADKKYSAAISIYTRALQGLPHDSPYQSRMLTFRGLAHELSGNKDKALDDYCMSVAYLTENESAGAARARIGQVVYAEADRIPMMAFAKTGVFKNTLPRGGGTKYKVNAPQGQDYIVKIESVGNPSLSVFMYVRGGTSFQTEFRPGKYRILHASGSVWYGPKELFGEETEFQKTVSRFSEDNGEEITFKPNMVKTHELRAKTDGNAATQTISRDEFGM